MASAQPVIGIIMGSRSDWETMRHAAETLARLGIAHETRIVSAHRTPHRLVLPVLGVPIESRALNGLDSLLSIVQMPGGVPVGTLAIGKPGAINAALLAAGILALGDATVAEALDAWRQAQTAAVSESPDGGEQAGG